MALARMVQQLQRFTSLYLFTMPGFYQVKRLRILKEMVKLGTQYMNSLEEEYWIDFGTLLGYYREGGVIPHDIDVDFSMHASGYEKVLAKKSLVPKELKLIDSSHRHNGPKLYLSYKGFDIDIYFYRDTKEGLQSTEDTKWENERRVISRDLIYPLKENDFLGYRVFVPNKTEEYLKFIYGYLGTNGRRNGKTGFWEERTH